MLSFDKICFKKCQWTYLMIACLFLHSRSFCSGGNNSCFSKASEKYLFQRAVKWSLAPGRVNRNRIVSGSYPGTLGPTRGSYQGTLVPWAVSATCLGGQRARLWRSTQPSAGKQLAVGCWSRLALSTNNGCGAGGQLLVPPGNHLTWEQSCGQTIFIAPRCFKLATH